MRRRGLLTVAAIVIVVLLLAIWGEPGRLLLRYERHAILAPARRELWRLITAHWVHGSWRHTGLNLAGLLLMTVLFRGSYRVTGWLCIVISSATAIDLGFLLFMPQLNWYVGMSGVLHGVLAAGAVAWWRSEDRRLAAALTVILIGKLIWEQWQGALPLAGEMPVVINAHLYGAIGGLLGGFACIRTLPSRTVTRVDNL